MRIIIESEPWRDTLAITIGEVTGSIVNYAAGFDEEGNIIWRQAPDVGYKPAPVLVLDRSTAEALAQALGTYVPETAATVEALQDARATRDRALAMVELAMTFSFTVPP